MTPRFLPSALLLVAATLFLSGCNSARILLCPGAAILADAATRPVIKPGAAADPSAEIYRVEITSIDTACTLDRHAGQTDSSVTLAFRATRAPNGQAAHYAVPYFIAINQADRVINKRAYIAQIDFAPGAASVTFTTRLDSTLLKLENGHLPTDYQFLAGLEVSDAERAYLGTMGRYAP